MAHFLFAWELGANLGHATRLRAVARALKARGHRLTFVLRDVVGTRDLLGSELGPIFQAPLWLNTVVQPAHCMADILLLCGYSSTRTLSGLTDAWRALIELSGCDVLLADHSPTALLAARLAGVPAVHVGHGFSLPPRESPLPVFRDWANVPGGHAAQSDARALASVNHVLFAGGALPLPNLCDLFYPEKTLLCAWAEFDHYAGRGRTSSDYRGPDCEFVPGVAPSWPGGKGPRVFAYLRASHPEHAEVLNALNAEGCVTVCFCPDRAASTTAPAESPQLRYSIEPVDMQQALSTCELVVCHAGQATVAQATRFGIPCLMLATQTEQFLLARQLERSGVGINAAAVARPVDYRTLIAELLKPNGRHVLAARAMAKKYRHFDPIGLTIEIADALEELAPATA